MRAGLILIVMSIIHNSQLGFNDFKEIHSYSIPGKKSKYNSKPIKCFYSNKYVQNQLGYHNKTIPRSDKGSRQSYIGKEIKSQNKRNKIRKDLAKRLKS